MSNYRRYFVPGGSYFFTINLLERRNNPLLTTHIDALRDAVRRTKADRPFRIDGWVVLPEHMHLMMTLPPGDTDFSNRIKSIKMRFNYAIPPTERRSDVRVENGERGIWQRRFWEHAIRDERDFERHLGYVHFNPVKHGHAASARDWPYSTFHQWVERGVYPLDWASGDTAEFDAGEQRCTCSERSPAVPLRSVALVEPLRVPPYAATKLHAKKVSMTSLSINPAVDADTEGMRSLLNEIIRVGGTTAFTSELSIDEMRDWFISGENVVSCLVGVDSNGAIVGFQSLSKCGSLPAGWVDIATFASRSRHKSGVGSALFARTREAASKLRFSAINATIRVVNEGGLAYYSRMRFETYLVEDGDPQAQGRVFNRVHKRFTL